MSQKETEFYNYTLDYLQRAIHLQHAIQELRLMKPKDEIEKLCTMIVTKILEKRRKELLWNGLYPLKNNDPTNRNQDSNSGKS